MTPFVGFLPDIDPLTPGVITDCNYCYPTPSGFMTQKELTSNSSAIPAKCYGAKYLVKTDGTGRLFAGTQTKIYEGSVWTDVSRGASYSISTSTRWQFSTLGNIFLAANPSCVLQASTTGSFADVAGSPKAKCMDTGGGFVLLGNVDLGGGAGVEADRWICSAYEDHTGWTPSVITQCTTGRLVEVPGPITAIKSFGAGFVAYKANAVFIGEYSGDSDVFRWTCVSKQYGAASPESVVSVNGLHYFIGQLGLFVFDGSSVTPIDDGLNDWYIRNRSLTHMYLAAGTHDRYANCVYFFFVEASPVYGDLRSSKALVYNYQTRKFGVSKYLIDCLYETEHFPSLYPSVIGDDHKIYELRDSNKTSTMSITTGLIGDASQRSLVSGAKPHFKATPSSASVADYTSETDGVTLTSQATANMSNGRFDFFASARFHQLRYQFTGNCEVVGHTVSIQPDGEE